MPTPSQDWQSPDDRDAYWPETAARLAKQLGAGARKRRIRAVADAYRVIRFMSSARSLLPRAKASGGGLDEKAIASCDGTARRAGGLTREAMVAVAGG